MEKTPASYTVSSPTRGIIDYDFVVCLFCIQSLSFDIHDIRHLKVIRCRNSVIIYYLQWRSWLALRYLYDSIHRYITVEVMPRSRVRPSPGELFHILAD